MSGASAFRYGGGTEEGFSSAPYRAALYIRLSREDGDKEESDSVGNQKKLLLGFVERNAEITVRDIYVDDGYSGTSFERPGFRRMIRDIEDKKVNCVIVKDLSRFGRDYIETGRYLEKYFPEKSVRFISLTDDIDSREKSYDLLLPLKNIFNEQYARDISVKIHAAVKAKQEAGEFVGAFACYGYRKCPGAGNRLAPDPYAAGIVRRIFLLYAGGMSKSEIAKTLNRESVPSPSAYKRLKSENYCNPGEIPGRGWTYSAVHQILRNEMYTGTMVQGKKTQKMRGRQRTVPRSDWIRVENTHEPLVDRGLWETVQKQMTVNRRSYSAVSVRNVFAGLARCGTCGSSMIRNSWRRADGSSAAVLYCGTYKRNGRVFCSPHRTDFRILEEAVKADLCTLLDCAGSYRDEIRRMMNEDAGRDGMEKNRLRKDLERVRRLSRHVYEDYREGLLTREEFLSCRADYEKKTELYTSRLQSLQKERGDRTVPCAAEYAVSGSAAEDLKNRIRTGTLKRDIVLKMISRIEVQDKRQLKIYYRFAADEGNCGFTKGERTSIDK